MAETFNPILEEGYVPTDEVGVLGTRKVRPKNPEFKAMPQTAIVIHRPRIDGSGPADADFEMLGDRQSASAMQMDSSSRFYRIDLSEHVIDWQIPAPSQDDDFAFVVKVVAVVAVTDAKRIAVLGVRDSGARLRPTMLEMVRSAASGFGIDDGGGAAREIERRLRNHVAECGISVRTVFALVEPDGWSADRLKQQRADDEQRQVQDHENRLRQLKREHAELAAEQMNQHEVALKKQQADVKVKLDQAEIEFQTELQKLNGPQQRELADVKAAIELEKLKQEAALDAERDRHRKARLDAEQSAQEQQRRHEKELAESQAAHDARLAEINATHAAKLAEIQRSTDSARESAEAEIARTRHQHELEEAAQLNAQIASDPGNIIGVLLALGDTAPVRAAVKMLEERQKLVWDRFKDLQKLDVLPKDELRNLALSLMRDPAGGAFGLNDDLDDDASTVRSVDQLIS